MQNLSLVLKDKMRRVPHLADDLADCQERLQEQMDTGYSFEQVIEVHFFGIDRRDPGCRDRQADRDQDDNHTEGCLRNAERLAQQLEN